MCLLISAMKDLVVYFPGFRAQFFGIIFLCIYAKRISMVSFQAETSFAFFSGSLTKSSNNFTGKGIVSVLPLSFSFIYLEIDNPCHSQANQSVTSSYHFYGKTCTGRASCVRVPDLTKLAELLT